MRYLFLALIMTSCATSRAPYIAREYDDIINSRMSTYVLESTDVRTAMTNCASASSKDPCENAAFTLWARKAEAKYTTVSPEEFNVRKEALNFSDEKLLNRLVAVHADRGNGYNQAMIERFFVMFAYEDILRDLEMTALTSRKESALNADAQRVAAENAAWGGAIQNTSYQMQINQQQQQIRTLQCQQYQQSVSGNRVAMPCR